MKRKEFFKSLAVGAAAIVVAPKVVAEQPEDTPKKHLQNIDVSLKERTRISVDPTSQMRFFINGKPYICDWKMFEAEQKWMENKYLERFG